MPKRQIKRQNSGFPKMEAVTRFANIPIVESGVRKAENAYEKVKESNFLFRWYFGVVEDTIYTTLDTVRPIVNLFESPLHQIDGVMCKSLEFVEEKIPAISLPPEIMLYNAKTFAQQFFEHPVKTVVDTASVAGVAFLESPVPKLAADKIDGAITVADKYIDKYLPADVQDTTDSNVTNEPNRPELATIKTIQHGQKVTRKLRRRLTQKTIEEAQALKKQTKEAIHILFYVGEMILTDPQRALMEGQQLWHNLSKNEPENQARPQNLEQLILLLTREAARKYVHLVNYLVQNIAVPILSIPGYISFVGAAFLHQFMINVFAFLEAPTTSNMKQLKHQTNEMVAEAKNKTHGIFRFVHAYTTNALEQLAIYLSGRIDAEKITVTSNSTRRRIPAQTTNSPMQNNINGVY